MNALDHPEGPEAAGEGWATAGPSMMLRIVRFRPLHVAFDRILRETILPDLARNPAVIGVLAGRKGPDEIGPRVLVSLWGSGPVTEGGPSGDAERLRSRYLEETTDHESEVLPVVLATGERASPHWGILRIARGELTSMSVTRYAEDVREGMEADRRLGHGPGSLTLAEAGERAFVTVSCWMAWSDLARATGASMDQPIHTKRMEDIQAFSVEHLELLPVSPSTAGS